MLIESQGGSQLYYFVLFIFYHLFRALLTQATLYQYDNSMNSLNETINKDVLYQVFPTFASESPLTSIASPHWYKCTQDITDLIPLASP